jgi:phosphate butyryltransferase
MHVDPLRSSDDLIRRAIQIARDDRPMRVAVAAAQDADVIDAVSQCAAKGFLSGHLVGDRRAIEKLASENNIDISQLEIIDHIDPLEAAHHAVKLASIGQADLIMKGFLPTSSILKVVLDKRYNLRGENTLSHCAVLDIPGYPRLLNITDGGMVVKPDLEQKIQVLQNALVVAKALGCIPTNVAVSAAVCHMHDLPSDRRGAMEEFLVMAKSRCTDLHVQGPLTFDAATKPEAAQARKVAGPAAGDADVFLVDSVEEGNIISKTLIQCAEAVFAGVIVGAHVPVALVSRTDTVKNKIASLAVACVVAKYQQSLRGRAA